MCVVPAVRHTGLKSLNAYENAEEPTRDSRVLTTFTLVIHFAVARSRYRVLPGAYGNTRSVCLNKWPLCATVQ